jgi:hypothetical protein
MYESTLKKEMNSVLQEREVYRKKEKGHPSGP